MSKATLGYTIPKRGRPEPLNVNGGTNRGRKKINEAPGLESANPSYRIGMKDYLELFREEGASKQFALFTQKTDVELKNLIDPDTENTKLKIRSVTVRVQSGGGKCVKGCGAGGVEPAEEHGGGSGQETAKKMFSCQKCKEIKEYHIDTIPHHKETENRSVWEDFTIHLGFETHTELNVSSVQARPDSSFLGIFDSIVTSTEPIAVSKDMRFLARSTKNEGETRAIEVINMDTSERRNLFELPDVVSIQTLDISCDSALLTASVEVLQEGHTRWELVLFSMISMKEVHRISFEAGERFFGSFSYAADKICGIALKRGHDVSTADLVQIFLTYSEDLAKGQILDEKTAEEAIYRDREGAVQVERNGVYKATLNPEPGEEGHKKPKSGNLSNRNGNLLLPFTVVTDVPASEDSGPNQNQADGAHRKRAVSLDFKRHKGGSSSAKVQKFLNCHEKAIWKGSVSKTAIFAHTFNPDFRGEESEAKKGCLGKTHAFKTLLPDDRTVLVWNLRTSIAELCHRFEHERSVTCLRVSSDGTILIVGVSGMVSRRDHQSKVKLERSEILVYSLLTREVLWRIPLMFELIEANLTNEHLEFTVMEPVATDLKKGQKKKVMIPINESTPFPCAIRARSHEVTEIKLQNSIKEKLAISLDSAVTSYMMRTKSKNEGSLASPMTGARDARAKGGLVSPTEDQTPWFDPLASPAAGNSPKAGNQTKEPLVAPAFNQSQHAPLHKADSTLHWHTHVGKGNMTGLCVSDDARWYVAKWDPQKGGKSASSWLSIGDIDDDKGHLNEGQNLLLVGLHEESTHPETLARTIGCSCISSDGSMFASSVDHERRVVVMTFPRASHLRHVAGETIFWEFDADVVPSALAIAGEMLSVMGDKTKLSFSPYGEKECLLQTYSLLTKKSVSKSTFKCSGETLGIDGKGLLRVSENREHRVLLHRIATGELLYEIFDSNFKFLSISGNGGSLILRDCGHEDIGECGCKSCAGKEEKGGQGGSCVCKETLVGDHRLKRINLKNFMLFGPSLETCETWETVNAMGEMLQCHKGQLSRWPLLDPFFDRDKKSGRWSAAVSKLVHKKDYHTLQVITEACPVMWACLSPISFAGEVKNNDFFQMALENNDRVFAQLLLEGVHKSVSNEQGSRVPVEQMGKVTCFIRCALERQRMVDLVEKFLKELPLIKVDETASIKHVWAHFRRGKVLVTGWAYRDAEAITGAWGLEHSSRAQDKKSKTGNLDRGYQYVVALPGMCSQEFLEPMLGRKASPGLFDNESMRATVRVLEHDLQTKILGLNTTWKFVVFIVCLVCFCLFADLCVVSVADDGFSKFTLKELLDQFWGVVGVILGSVSSCLNIVFLGQEIQQMSNCNPISTYITAWNILPWLSNCASIACFVLFLLDASTASIRVMAGIAVILLFSTVFSFLRSFRPLSALVTMLIQIMRDMLTFVGVVALLIVSFAGGFYCLHGNLLPEAERPVPNSSEPVRDGPSSNVFIALADSIARCFILSVLFGGDVDDLRSPIEGVGGILSFFSFLFFFSLVMLVGVVGMNALIAIMGSTYQRVADREKSVRDKEVTAVMLSYLRNYSKKQKSLFEGQRRWVHVLSPSEKGSMPLGAAGHTLLDKIKRELLGLDTSTNNRFLHVEELINQQGELNDEFGQSIRNLEDTTRDSQNETQNTLVQMSKNTHQENQDVKEKLEQVAELVRSLDAKRASESSGTSAADANLMIRLQKNQEIILAQMLQMQKEVATLNKTMQSFEWQLNGVEMSTRHTSTLLSPLQVATRQESPLDRGPQ